MSLTYDEALDFLFPRTTTIKFGLANTRALLTSVGNPHELIPSIHIGGTNGKGSVSNLVAAALRQAGWRVGLYTSPHLISFRERIQVDGVPISEEAVAMWTGRLLSPILERKATFFEATTALAFADFAARGAEIAVVEVGLGGRLDSTNVVQPLVSGVTKIERDHMKYLGETLEQIAGEKAGIAKPGVPFVIGEPDPALVNVLRREARRAVTRADPKGKADIRVLPADYLMDRPPMSGRAPPATERGRGSGHSDGTASALSPDGRADRAGVRVGQGRWAARSPGTLALRRGPQSRWHALAGGCAGGDPPARPLHALVSILGDKEWPEMLVQLDQAIDRGVLTIAPTAAARGWDIEWLRRWLRDPSRPPAHAEWTLVPDFQEAIEIAQEDAGTVLVTGSFHTVGDVMSALGMEV